MSTFLHVFFLCSICICSIFPSRFLFIYLTSWQQSCHSSHRWGRTLYPRRQTRPGPGLRAVKTNNVVRITRKPLQSYYSGARCLVSCFPSVFHLLEYVLTNRICNAFTLLYLKTQKHYFKWPVKSFVASDSVGIQTKWCPIRVTTKHWHSIYLAGSLKEQKCFYNLQYLTIFNKKINNKPVPHWLLHVTSSHWSLVSYMACLACKPTDPASLLAYWANNRHRLQHLLTASLAW